MAADPFADIPVSGGSKDPFADIPLKTTETEGGAAITFPSPLPKREKGFASGVVSGLTGDKGPSIMSQTPSAKAFRKGEELGEPLGIAADIGMTAVPGYKAGKAGFDALGLLRQRLSLGKTAKQLAEDLRLTGTKRAGEVAKTAGSEMTAAEQRAAIAGKAEEKAGRETELALRPLPGVTTEQEAGRFKPIAQTTQDIGTRIKDAANNVMDRLKATRETNVQANKQAAFGEAFQKEASGQNVTQTKAYKNALDEIDAMRKNPVTGLSGAPVAEIDSQLQKVRGMLDRKIVDADGTVISRPPPSFEGLEEARRFLRDRSFGVPAEGYDAISQQMAGRLADRIEAIMKEFSPGVDKFLNQYSKDSQPLRVFQSKLGKSLTGEQLAGTGANFATVPAKDIPGRVFGSKENFDALTAAFGGDRKLAEAEAKRYFASQLESKATAKDAENFIRQNRAMLKETGSLPMAEKYAVDLRTFEKRGVAAKGIGKTEADIAKQKGKAVQDFQTFQSDLEVAGSDPAKITSVSNNMAKKLLDDGYIGQLEYRDLQRQIEKVRLTTRDANEMKNQIKVFVYRALGYGAVATVGGYGAMKLFE